MKSKIAYVELDTHAEIAGNFMKLMADSSEFSIDYYFSEKVLKTLQLQDKENVFKASPQDILQQLQTQKYDKVIVGTVHRYFNIFEKITNRFHTAIICHNLNFVNADYLRILSNLFKNDFSFRLKLLLKEGLLRKNNVYRQAKQLWVLDEHLAHGKFQFLPVFFTEKSKKETKDIFTIVVPGRVSQQRRDYKTLMQKLRKWSSPHRFRIVFLGKASGEELLGIQRLKIEQKEQFWVEYFTEKIPQSKFDEWMKRADVLWCPVQEKTDFLGIKEYYGKTKMSGNIGDAITYSKMAVFPENYQGKYPFVVPEVLLFKEKTLFENYPVEIGHFFETHSKEKVLCRLENTLKSFIFAEGDVEPTSYNPKNKLK